MFSFPVFSPYLQDGQRGHLEGLASVYVELLDAPFNEVLSGLENARLAAWAEQSPQHQTGMCHQGHRGSSSQGGLPNSHSQPIYVPGKYSVSVFTHTKILPNECAPNRRRRIEKACGRIDIK